MSGKYATPLTIEPSPAVRAGHVLLAIHGCAVLVPLLSGGLPAFVRILLALWLLLVLLWQWPRHVTHASPDSVVRMTWKEGRACHLLLRDGRELEVSLGHSAFVQPWLVVINFSVGRWRRRYLLLLPDMLDHDTFRRLRVRLRMELQHKKHTPGFRSTGNAAS